MEEEKNKVINEITEKKSIAWGVTSMVTGIGSLLLFLAPYFGLPLAIFAIVANHLQKKRQPSGMGTAGMICGILGIVINGIMLFFVGFALLLMAGTGTL